MHDGRSGKDSVDPLQPAVPRKQGTKHNSTPEHNGGRQRRGLFAAVAGHSGSNPPLMPGAVGIIRRLPLSKLFCQSYYYNSYFSCGKEMTEMIYFNLLYVFENVTASTTRQVPLASV
ncbi:hypothetical protein GDO78_017725 [Eleutherodactylus coqui]|uniref:Uncharacterized protein n=1 Tax=Eleutherodactylus coqui TaxID=57060 RepID=A0A8J6EB65_ELECQ|nr:hypothetical protein GDO78_017725 [Eleutherodactylus coqui]